jgi:putative transcriptional regulator
MKTKSKSAPSSQKLKSTPPKSPRTKLGRDIAAGLTEVLAHVRGSVKLEGYKAQVPETVDVAKIRARLGMSQRTFAGRFGLDVTALHAWEQNRRQPDRAARVLLTIIQREPEAVMRALDGQGSPAR